MKSKQVHSYPKDNISKHTTNIHNRSIIRVSALKQFACEKLPKDSPLLAALNVEDEEILASEYPEKLRIWLRLLHYSLRRE